MDASHVVVLILLIGLVIMFTIILPVLSGVGSYSAKPVNSRSSLQDDESEESTNNAHSTSNQYTGYTYQTPDVEDEDSSEKTHSETGLKRRINKLKNITSDDIPIKFGINAPKVDHDTPQRKFINNGSTEFDYDVDEFIEREHAKDMSNRYN